MAERYTRDSAQISVVVGGSAYTGWLQSEVSRSIETLAATFSIPVALVPGAPPAIQRQDRVQVRVGDTTVVDGFVLAAEPFYRADDCGMRIIGRDRAGDLVRCSAIHRGGQWRNAKLDRIAQDLVTPFGLQVEVATDLGPAIGDFKMGHGETVLDALARAARLQGVLVTRSESGQVLLTKAGQQRFKGVIRRGWNVIEAESIGSDEDRHSEYLVYGQGNVLGTFDQARLAKGRAEDPGLGRHMPLVINADGNTTAAELQRLAEHTMRVRRGHSVGVRYVVEGWTFEGTPWPINQRVAIHDDVMGLAGEEWLIASARMTCSLRDGDITELVLRPAEAYDRVPLKSRPVRRPWGNKGNTTNHPRGPRDGALGGER